MSLHFDPIERLSAIQELGGIYPGLLEGQGLALDRIQEDVDSFDVNLVPDTIEDDSILSRWESIFGIVPVPGDSVELRRTRILARLVATGGLSKPYFEGLAAALGFVVTIIDPVRPFRAGVGRAGDATRDPLLGFRAFSSSSAIPGILLASTSRDDRSLHFAHNDRGENLRVYSEDDAPRVWTWGVEIFGSSREAAEILIDTFLELKPAFTFLEWKILGDIDSLIDEGSGVVGVVLDEIDEGSGGSVSIADSIDSGNGLI